MSGAFTVPNLAAVAPPRRYTSHSRVSGDLVCLALTPIA